MTRQSKTKFSPNFTSDSTPVDPILGLSFFLVAQFTPWASPPMLKLRDDCEKLIVESRATECERVSKDRQFQ